jgi:uncharacterized membrane protein
MSAASTHPGTGRIEAFSDAVIAIALTIMVLDLRPPGGAMDHDSLPALADYLTPRLTCYALSFLIIAKMWVSHHQLLSAASHATTPLMWLNNLLLFWMSLIPFATGYLSQDPSRPLAVATYGVVLFLNASSFTLMRYYVVTHLLRVDRAVYPHLIRLSMAAMALYGLGAAMAYVSVHLSFALFILVPILSIPVDRQVRVATDNAAAANE